jgi:hypothetical protein
MTVPRQERKGWCCPGNALIAPLAVLFTLAGLPFAVHAAVTERVVLNRFSGLAIEGFDPVAYFTDGKPVLGREEFEAFEAGVIWRFHNEGDRASFVAHPEIYGPQFGGYDPLDVARGIAVAGNPYFWLISGQRLYLFSREESRAAFAANAANIVRRANLRWPEVRHGLAQ